MSEQHIEVEGRVITVLPGTMFRVELDNKHVVLATICGKMRKRWVRLTVGDRVKTLRGSMHGVIKRILDDGRVVWQPEGTQSEFTALPESLLREEKSPQQ